MSTLYPYIDMPYPNFAMEDQLAPNPVVPVREVTPVVPARSAEALEERAPGEEIVLPDAVEVSAAGRELSEEAAAATARDSVSLDSGARYDPVANAQRIRDNMGVRELIASFDNYDNTAAQERFANYLQYFASYAASPVREQAGDAMLADVRGRENALYAELGFLPANVTASTPVARRMALAIDGWLAGQGVFTPSMLAYSSSDGFRFTPLTAASQASLRAADTLASYERTRIAQYLREMATLTPEDFMFYDPTGLGALPLQERRDFLQRMDQLLEQARIDARAADLRYVFDENGKLVLEDLGLTDESELDRLDAMAEVVNSYYAMLLASVQQYKSGMISVSLKPEL